MTLYLYILIHARRRQDSRRTIDLLVTLSLIHIFSLTDLLKEIIEMTAYVESLEAEDKEDAQARIENIDELLKDVYKRQSGHWLFLNILLGKNH